MFNMGRGFTVITNHLELKIFQEWPRNSYISILNDPAPRFPSYPPTILKNAKGT